MRAGEVNTLQNAVLFFLFVLLVPPRNEVLCLGEDTALKNGT